MPAICVFMCLTNSNSDTVDSAWLQAVTNKQVICLFSGTVSLAYIFLDQELIYRYSSCCCWGDLLKKPKAPLFQSDQYKIWHHWWVHTKRLPSAYAAASASSWSIVLHSYLLDPKSCVSCLTARQSETSSGQIWLPEPYKIAVQCIIYRLRRTALL